MPVQLHRVSRRQFIGTGALALVAAHDRVAAMADAFGGAPLPPAVPRIRSLELLTAAPLAAMKRFYRGAIGLGVLEDGRDRLSIAAGLTRLTFVPAAPAGRAPFYHFAFNIPENKIVAALRWQEARGPMLPIPPRNRDPRYPDQVVDYRHWNAHSIFFLDPGGNLVEYIARHDLANGADGPFSAADILYASEIAFVVDDVAAAAEAIRSIAGVGQYRGGSDQFVAAGDETGLLLIMKRGRIIDFSDSNSAMAVTVFPTRAGIRAPQAGVKVLPGFPYQITCEDS